MAVEPVKVNTTGMNLDSFNQIYSNKYDAGAGTNVLNISESTKSAYEDTNLEFFQVDVDNDGQLDNVYRVDKVDENGTRTAMGYVNSTDMIDQWSQAQAQNAGEGASAQAAASELQEIPTDLPEIPTDVDNSPSDPGSNSALPSAGAGSILDGSMPPSSDPGSSSALPSAGAGAVLDDVTHITNNVTDNSSVLPSAGAGNIL